jgi:glucokinase
MILAGDIGGTKTRLGLFDGCSTEAVASATYATHEADSLVDMIESFLDAFDARPLRACLGVAAAVRGRRVGSVMLPWAVDADELERRLRLETVTLVNDVEANARGITALAEHDFAVLSAGAADAFGTCAVVSAGTGLGEAALWWDGTIHRPAASEGGSASFAPRSEREVALYRFIAAERGRVSWGDVCSGRGLRNIYRFLTGEPEALEPAAITAEAFADRTSAAGEAVDMFTAIYGSRAGDVALSYFATGGVYLGGGIAPKLLPRLTEGRFMEAFLEKGSLGSQLRRIPVRVVLNTDAALIGAALFAYDQDPFEYAVAA